MFENMNSKLINVLIDEEISRYWNIEPKNANSNQVYRAVCVVIRDILLNKRNKFINSANKKGKKQVYYMCMEFLLGKSMKNSLHNLHIEKEAEEALKKYNVTLQELYDIEKDPGLGNGGLGRLAACFMDSLATLNYPATGYSIKYEFGLFKQKIIDGWQTELPDDWLTTSDAWLVPKTEERVTVKFDGTVQEVWTENGLKINYLYPTEIEAIPYDMFISGSDSEGVSLLRLWESRSLNSIDMNLFSQGDYIRALSEDSMAEAISKVLYPSDNHSEGKILRLKQQYFLVSASAQDIVRNHFSKYSNFDNFSEKCAIHINDTHPALIIPELMRIFMDEYNYSWEKSWDIVTNTVSYTNHTVLTEALETFDVNIVKAKLPRIHMIIAEINKRFLDEAKRKYNGDWNRAVQMSIFSYDRINMANLCIVGSHTVNGVASLHTEILKRTVFKNFYDYSPNKFMSITNGIAHRRWLNQANPQLKKLLDNLIGPGYSFHAENLYDLKKYYEDDSVLEKLDNIKYNNKKRLAEYVMKNEHIALNIDSIFDIQAKRLHEYKRQLLNALRIISLIIDINDGNTEGIVPETFIFAAKAAPGYFRAKETIKLIYALSEYINKNTFIKKYIDVVFLENYSVSLAELIIPAGELSEQISLAGKEASGTGNMKFMLNGAVTIGTYDGANVEIINQVGEENFFLFGMRDYEVENLWKKGYSSIVYYQKNIKLRKIIDFLNKGISGKSFESISKYLIGGPQVGDPYMCFADYDSYMDVHKKASLLYFNDKRKWNQMSLMNIACAGVFSSDRSIKEYADKIWNLKTIND
ncbi:MULTISPECIES: glycogen/starch/alpha-glucan phosphorylase [unclassified Sedimentibacter]|uniref:glycogen/starch/alpha-glucan phosphorylase n=1 Tax=unclassified Sedimentibacter TaxID=2649220 RepID=UPI0027DF735C|nr:glycogen/starch/alpha-glucan phosphorylase [Sedimentibacter sp. MB35-C1]WMJ78181.1 glycogen/starch/alpha-glucan phosphorylase [Sedimentibacter sp. MB35-C1]